MTRQRSHASVAPRLDRFGPGDVRVRHPRSRCSGAEQPMTLLRFLDELDPAVTELGCPHCKAIHSLDECFDASYLRDDRRSRLRCPHCDRSGLIPRGGQAIEDRFPWPLGLDFHPLPQALTRFRLTYRVTNRNGESVEHRFDATDLAIVVVLSSYARHGQAWVFPSRETIADQAGCSTPTVGRRLKDLEDAGLIKSRRMPGRHGRFGHLAYCLEPLWARLAELESATATAPSDVWPDEPSPPGVPGITGEVTSDPWDHHQASQGSPPVIRGINEEEVREEEVEEQEPYTRHLRGGTPLRDRSRA